jgi:hypothetical protein
MSIPGFGEPDRPLDVLTEAVRTLVGTLCFCFGVETLLEAPDLPDDVGDVCEIYGFNRLEGVPGL